MLMEHFLRGFFRRRGEDVPPISDAVKQAFMRYSWPGNVRELENACERIAQTCSCGTVRVGCVSASVLFHAGAEPVRTMPPLRGVASGTGSELRCAATDVPVPRRRPRPRCSRVRPRESDDRRGCRCRRGADFARRSAQGGRSESHYLGAEGERREQVEGRGAVAHQAVDAWRPNQPLRAWPHGTDGSRCVKAIGRSSIWNTERSAG